MLLIYVRFKSHYKQKEDLSRSRTSEGRDRRAGFSSWKDEFQIRSHSFWAWKPLKGRRFLRMIKSKTKDIFISLSKNTGLKNASTIKFETLYETRHFKIGLSRKQRLQCYGRWFVLGVALAGVSRARPGENRGHRNRRALLYW